MAQPFGVHSTNSRTFSFNSSSQTSFDEIDEVERRHANLSKLFIDASQYKRAIHDSPTKGFKHLPRVQESMADFVELVGSGLDSYEKALANRFAQLSFESLAPPDEDGSGPVTEEPDELSEEDMPQSPINARPIEIPTGNFNAAEEEESRSNSPTLPLDPTSVVSVLQQELGALHPKDEEKLVFEADGALVQDVILLGVIHVTTHRIAFHASLPPPNPNQDASNFIIKAGTAILHRKGLHRKRRIWLELSQDFVSTYNSAREEDHIRPRGSIMLSSFQEVLPEDADNPKSLRGRLEESHRFRDFSLEFDTAEATRSWRRELKAAIFHYKRRVQSAVGNQNIEETDGVRVSIPLECVNNHSRERFAETLYVHTLTVSSNSERDAVGSATDRSRDSGDSIPSVVQFADPHMNEMWDKFDAIVAARKETVSSSDVAGAFKSVVVDFGLGRESAKPADSPGNAGKSQERLICDIIGIDYSPEVLITRACLLQNLACSGFLVISSVWIGFWCKSIALRDTIYRIPVASIRSVASAGSVILPTYTVTLEIEGRTNLNFQFRSVRKRDEALQRINMVAATMKASRISSPISTPPLSPSGSSDRFPPSRSSTQLLAPISRLSMQVTPRIEPHTASRFPKPVNLPVDRLFQIPSKNFVCLTIGSRGDVQPYIALGLGLLKAGHKVTIVTHPEYKSWIESFGIQHRDAGGDPGALMKLSVEHKMFSPQFFQESIGYFRSWLDQLLLDAWESCRDAEVLLESPYAMAGVHIADALHIPYFRVCTMPWTKTTEFPHAFISPPVETPHFNSMSYVLFDNVFWFATSFQINRWRRDTLHIEATDMSHLAQSNIPVLYNFSPALVPKPLDWSDDKILCGYWFLANPDQDWDAPESLLTFMKKARDEGKPLVYIGFGSITVPDPNSVSNHIFRAVVKSDVRAIVSRGWSNRMSKQLEAEPEAPEQCYMIDKVPHDWLFPQIDAAMHHGGAGTTGASLRAGIPTLIKPWFGDQFFWASRVHKMGAGLRVPSLRVNDIANALAKATTDRIMKEKAANIGEKIRAEDGVRTAITSIYTYLSKAVRGSDSISKDQHISSF